MGFVLGDGTIVMGIKDSPFHRGMSRIHRRLGLVQRRLQVVAQKSRMMFMIGGAAMALSVREAVKFEEQMAKVSTMLSGEAMGNMDAYRQGVNRMAVDFGQSTKALTDGLYDILSAQIPPAQAMQLLERSSKMATAGFTGTGNATSALITVLNAYGLTTADAADVSDKLFATVKMGRLTFEDLASSIGRVATLAKLGGLRLEELLASIATITRAGIDSATTMTALTGTINTFLKPTREAIDTVAELNAQHEGLNLILNKNALQTEGLVGVVRKLSKASAEQLAKIVPNVRAFRALGPLLQDQEGYVKDLAVQYNASGLTAEAFAKATGTLAFQLRQAKESTLAVARSLGDALAPAVADVAARMREISEPIARWIEANQFLVSRVVQVTAAVGLSILVLPKLVGLLKLLAGAMMVITAHPIIAVVTAVLALGAVVAAAALKGDTLRKKWESLTKALAAFWQWLEPLRVAIQRALVEVWAAVTPALQAAWTFLQEFFNWLAPVIADAANYILDKLVTAFNTLAFAVRHFGEVASIGWDIFLSGMVSGWEDIKHLFTVQLPELFTWFVGATVTMLKNIVTVHQTVWKNIGKNIDAVLTWVFGRFWKTFKNMAGIAGEIVGWIFDQWKSTMGGLIDAGIWWFNATKKVLVKVGSIALKVFSTIREVATSAFDAIAEALGTTVEKAAGPNLDAAASGLDDIRKKFEIMPEGGPKWVGLLDGLETIAIEGPKLSERVVTETEKALATAIIEKAAKLKKLWEEMFPKKEDVTEDLDNWWQEGPGTWGDELPGAKIKLDIDPQFPTGEDMPEAEVKVKPTFVGIAEAWKQMQASIFAGKGKKGVMPGPKTGAGGKPLPSKAAEKTAKSTETSSKTLKKIEAGIDRLVDQGINGPAVAVFGP